MAPWYEAAEFYHIYPLGLCGAPARNEQEEVTHRFDLLNEWLEHAADLGFTAITGPSTADWETMKISGSSSHTPMNWA